MTTFRTLAIALAITACGGGSKKAAEQAAARIILEKLGRKTDING